MHLLLIELKNPTTGITIRRNQSQCRYMYRVVGNKLLVWTRSHVPSCTYVRIHAREWYQVPTGTRSSNSSSKSCWQHTMIRIYTYRNMNDIVCIFLIVRSKRRMEQIFAFCCKLSSDVSVLGFSSEFTTGTIFTLSYV